MENPNKCLAFLEEKKETKLDNIKYVLDLIFSF
jgi:hypothetical protein